VTIDLILDATCAHFRVPRAHLSLRKPNLRTIYIRAVASFLVRELTTAQYMQLAAALDNLGRGPRQAATTLALGVRRVGDGSYPAAVADLKAIRALLSG
jgi:hypothetical protein